MRLRLTRLFSLLLALLLGLTACNAGGKPREIHKVNWVTSPAYLAEDIELPVPTGDLIGCCTDGEYIYVLADEKAEDEVRSILFRASLADGTAEILEEYHLPEIPEDAYMNRYGPTLAPDGSIWMYEAWHISYYDLPEDFDPENDSKYTYRTGFDEFLHLRQLDPATGRQKKLVDLSEAAQALGLEDAFDVTGFAVDGGENIYLSGPDGISVLNSRGNLLFTLEAATPDSGTTSGDGGPMALLPDGSVAVLTLRPGGREVRSVDSAAKDWGAVRYTLPNGVDRIYSGTGGFLFFYLSGGNFYGWEPEAEEGRILLTRSAIDLDGVITCFAPLDGGTLAVLTSLYDQALTGNDYWYTAKLRLSLLSPSDKAPDEGKIKLVYGTIGEDQFLRARIDQFNKENDRYYIELRNYLGEGINPRYDLNSSEERSARTDAATKLLHAEVASGKIPDIWDRSLPLDLYARKGYFEDLWPFIDNDEELGGRDALMARPLECASIGGKLYKISNSFSIKTAAANPAVVGNRTSWTLEEMLDIYRSMPEGSSLMGENASGESILLYFLQRDMDRWVDWSTGECSFNTPAFKEILEMCAPIPGREWDEIDWSTYDRGEDLRKCRQLIEPVTLMGPSQITDYDALFGGPEHLWDYYTYLTDNHVTSNGASEDGSPAARSDALSNMEIAKASGMFYGYFPLSSDAVFGAVEGGGYANYIGFPTQNGSGSCFQLPNGISNIDDVMSMSASCRHKEGAWAFMRQLLLPVDPDELFLLPGTTPGSFARKELLGFPINKAAFEQAMSPDWLTYEDENGEQQYLLDGEGNRIEDPDSMLILLPSPALGYNGGIENEVKMAVFDLAPNETQMAQFMALYNSIDRVALDDEDLTDIILEQAQPYFAGDKSLDETADLIQRRATLYVNENR